MMNDFETQKNIADKLSALLPIKSENEREQALEMLKELGFSHLPEPVRVVDETDSFPPGNIGIYKPKTVDGEIIYERDTDYIDRWTYFANTPTFRQKKAHKRIAFLGESVARGLLLDPDYTPAMVLKKLFSANSSNDKFEVVDLAETNMPMRAIRNRFIQCLDLQPDLVVFFAGNNWYNDCIVEISHNKEIFNTLNNAINQANNIGEIKPQLEKVIEKLVIDFLTFVNQKMKEHKFPVVMVIPEFNLMDCRSTPGERRVTYLAGDGIKKWSEAYKKANKAQIQGELEQVAVHAKAMIDIDSSHPLGYEMLADVKIKQKDYVAGRELLELGRDTALFNRSNSKPRIFQVIRKTILEHAPKLGIETLDIAEVFKHHLNGEIPGKDLFLDYCHLTVEGIQIAMEPLADIVLRLTGNQNKNVLKASNIRPSKLTLAMGYFYAAIHNEHWGQPYYLQKYYCLKALKTTKDVSKIMIYYCDMMTRNVSSNLTKSLEMIFSENIKVDYHGHAYLHGKGLKLMDIALVNAMVDTLKLEGINLTKFINELRKKEHGVQGKTIDLLSRVYHATSLDEFQGIRPAFFQATDTSSRFFVIADAGVSIDLFISFRIPSFEPLVGTVELWFNDSKIATLDGQSKWINHELTVSGDYCKDGINELIIFWPIPETVDKSLNQEFGNSSSLISSMYYVFGEISHFKAMGTKEKIDSVSA